MRKILTGLCVIFVLSVAPLAHSDSVDPKQFGQFGQCAVVTQVDDFTDAKSPLLFCKGEGDSLGSYGVSVTCRQGKFGTAFLAGIQFHMDETIDVLYRFDKGELTTNTWRP